MNTFSQKYKILTSACLAGLNVRYDGKNKFWSDLVELEKSGYIELITFCPEDFKLGTPRNSANLKGGTGIDVLNKNAQVIDIKGHDVTSQFLDGAFEMLRLAQLNHVDAVVLKERSPSCGVNKTHVLQSKQTSELVDGMGVAAALLYKHGFKLFTEHNSVEEIIRFLGSKT